MELRLDRKPSERETTFGQLFVNSVYECYTLEDSIRELAGVPVSAWKIPDQTAIPSGRYRVTAEASERFGPDTLTINNAPGFTYIRIHGGNKSEDTDGCIIIGDQISRMTMTISGALLRGVLKRLKAKVLPALAAGEEVWITINNPQGVPT